MGCDGGTEEGNAPSATDAAPAPPNPCTATLLLAEARISSSAESAGARGAPGSGAAEMAATFRDPNVTGRSIALRTSKVPHGTSCIVSGLNWCMRAVHTSLASIVNVPMTLSASVKWICFPSNGEFCCGCCCPAAPTVAAALAPPTAPPSCSSAGTGSSGGGRLSSSSSSLSS